MQVQISGMQEKKPAALTEEAIESYLQSVASQGRTKGTLANYRRSLSKFFQWLPGEKLLSQETVEAYRGHMIEDLHYTPNSINMNLTPINAILAYMGLWNYQVPMASLEKAEYQPEISRSEYLRLLSAAKQTNKEKVYLLIKVFATIGIQVQELPHLTVEAVRDGKVVTYPNRVRQVLRISPYVREELLQYIEKEGIATGPVFLTRAGRPISRTMVTTIIQNLSRDARVPEEKCNPRCLRKLYMKTMDTIQTNAAMMVQMTYDHLLEQEQSTYGWEDVKSHV